MIRVAITGAPQRLDLWVDALAELRAKQERILLCVDHELPLPVPWDGVVARYPGETIPDVDVCVAFEKTATACACEASGAEMKWRLAVPKHEFLWFDVETTGLDPQCGKILEFAAVLCEDARGFDLAITDEFTVVIHHDIAREIADASVQRMHEANGLWLDVAESTISLEDADALLEDYAATLSGGKERSIRLAGYSPHFDLAWARVWLPRFARYLNHQVFDLSTLKKAIQVWAPEGVRFPPRTERHRALEDVRHSIATANACRKVLAGGAP